METLPQSSLMVPLPPEAHSRLPHFIHQDPSPGATRWWPRRPASPAVCTASVGPRATRSRCAAPCRPTRPCAPVPARSSPGGAAPSAVSDLAESPEPRPLSLSLSSALPLSPSQPAPSPHVGCPLSPLSSLLEPSHHLPLDSLGWEPPSDFHLTNGTSGKEPACRCRRHKRYRSGPKRPGSEDPLEKGMATHPSILAWRIPTDRAAWQAAVHSVTKSQT